MKMMTAKRTLALVLALQGSLITSHLYAKACYGTKIGERDSTSCKEVVSSSMNIDDNFYFLSSKDKRWIQCESGKNMHYCNPPLNPNLSDCQGQDFGHKSVSSCKEVSDSKDTFFFQSKDTDKDGNLLSIQCNYGNNLYYCNP